MIVYLGLDPSRYIREGNLLHHPLIAIKKLITSGLSQAKAFLLPCCFHQPNKGKLAIVVRVNDLEIVSHLI
jgi:hydrogenase maturation factor